jgi:hypothetical protein
VAELLRPNVTDEMRGLVGVSVDVTVEAGDAHHSVGAIRAPVLGGVELLLGELRQEEAQPLELLRVQEPLKIS